MTRRIHAHHHLWSFNSNEFDWINDTMSMLRRDEVYGLQVEDDAQPSAWNSSR